MKTIFVNNIQIFRYFSGKEKDVVPSYSYFGAPYYMSDVSIWLSVDPMRDKYPYQSPYTYCGWNPLMIIDPDGTSEEDGIFVDGNGTNIGNDGKSDEKVYVLKTKQTSFGDADNSSKVAGAGLSQEEQDKTVAFIQSHSGDESAFKSDDIAYRNSIEIDGNADNRQAMVDEVGRDNGQGGMSPKNNREYGGYNDNGTIKTVPPGPIMNPRSNENASITIPSEDYSTFHGHCSGYAMSPKDDRMHGYTQSPSPSDIENAGRFTHYQFGMNKNDRNVYIYNSKGVQATIPINYFVNFKKINIMNLILKKIILIILLSITVTVGWSQVKENNFNKFINNSLLDIINNDKALINKGILRKDFFDITYLIMDQQYPSDFDFSDSITKLNLNVLKIVNTDLLTKKEKRLLEKGVSGIFFHGFVIDKNRITLRFTDEKIYYKKNTEYKEINYGKKMFFSEWTSTYDFIYEYSCEKQEWIFIKADYGGI